MSRTIEPKMIKGTRAGLLDRLVDTDPQVPHEPVPFQIVDHERLKESVRRELSWLLNTRAPRHAQRTERNHSIVNYGIPDLGTWSPQSHDDHQDLERIIAQVIDEFEPRLSHVHVRIEHAPTTSQSLQVTVHAMLKASSVMEPVAFTIPLD